MRNILAAMALAAVALDGCGKRQPEAPPRHAGATAPAREIAWPKNCPRRHFDVVEWIPHECDSELRRIERPDQLGLGGEDARYIWYEIGLDAYQLACRARGCFIKTAVYDRFADAA